jgi:hypothetical protein
MATDIADHDDAMKSRMKDEFEQAMPDIDFRGCAIVARAGFGALLCFPGELHKPCTGGNPDRFPLKKFTQQESDRIISYAVWPRDLPGALKKGEEVPERVLEDIIKECTY